jgi:hypothetical protein
MSGAKIGARIDARIAFEPFLDDDTRRFIVDGVDMHNVAATAMPDYGAKLLSAAESFATTRGAIGATLTPCARPAAARRWGGSARTQPG